VKLSGFKNDSKAVHPPASCAAAARGYARPTDPPFVCSAVLSDNPGNCAAPILQNGQQFLSLTIPR